MAKAMVTSMYALDIEDNLYKITGTAAVTTGEAGHVSVTFEAASSSFSPVLPNWQSIIRDAVIAAADQDNMTVDEVIVPSFGIL